MKTPKELLDDIKRLIDDARYCEDNRTTIDNIYKILASYLSEHAELVQAGNSDTNLRDTLSYCRVVCFKHLPILHMDHLWAYDLGVLDDPKNNQEQLSTIAHRILKGAAINKRDNLICWDILIEMDKAYEKLVTHETILPNTPISD